MEAGINSTRSLHNFSMDLRKMNLQRAPEFLFNTGLLPKRTHSFIQQISIGAFRDYSLCLGSSSAGNKWSFLLLRAYSLVRGKRLQKKVHNSCMYTCECVLWWYRLWKNSKATNKTSIECYGWFLVFDRKPQNSVKQLSFN